MKQFNYELDYSRIKDLRIQKNLSQKEIANLVGISDMELISAISIGYPDEKPKQKPRKKLNEILEWYEDGK